MVWSYSRYSFLFVALLFLMLPSGCILNYRSVEVLIGDEIDPPYSKTLPRNIDQKKFIPGPEKMTVEKKLVALEAVGHDRKLFDRSGREIVFISRCGGPLPKSREELEDRRSNEEEELRKLRQKYTVIEINCPDKSSYVVPECVPNDIDLNAYVQESPAIDVANKLEELNARCDDGKLVDGWGREIRFRDPFCPGDATASSDKINRNGRITSEEMEKYKSDFTVIVLACDHVVPKRNRWRNR